MTQNSKSQGITHLNLDEMKGLPLEEALAKISTYEDLSTFLKHTTGPLITKMLQAEMEEHLGYKKHSKEGYNSGNSRNGNYKKTLLTENGKIEIEVPRDRSSQFEPQIIPKFQTRTNEMEEKIINMYGLGLTTTDIQAHVRENIRSGYLKRSRE